MFNRTLPMEKDSGWLSNALQPILSRIAPYTPPSRAKRIAPKGSSGTACCTCPLSLGLHLHEAFPLPGLMHVCPSGHPPQAPSGQTLALAVGVPSPDSPMPTPSLREGPSGELPDRAPEVVPFRQVCGDDMLRFSGEERWLPGGLSFVRCFPGSAQEGRL
jgi:hypothetical protein